MPKPVIFLAFANDKEDNARYLRNLPLELDGIRKTLEKAVDDKLCEIIFEPNCNIEKIIDTFQKYQEQIVVFHYGSHADGYQLLLETLPTVADFGNGLDSQLSAKSSTVAEVAHGEGLVSFLAKQKGLQLIFFNGCTTEQQAQELSEKSKLAVIGTSSEIEDGIATYLAIRFYKGLGINLTIGKAWEDALTELKIRQGSENLRGLYRKEVKEIPQKQPWKLFSKDKTALDWRLNRIRKYSVGNIYKLLNASFNDESLQIFCQINFEDVHNNFGTGQSRNQKLMALIDYAKRKQEVEKLLDLVAEENPAQFEQFKPYFD
jgi:Effector-associated domain 7